MMKWLLRTIAAYLVIRKQRQQLLSMDESMRKDLAISRVDAEQLAGRYRCSNTQMKEKNNERTQPAGL
jgi:uncharacterized protein YjiS (DUF1127 family)